jgi:hypothetical protein
MAILSMIRLEGNVLIYFNGNVYKAKYKDGKQIGRAKYYIKYDNKIFYTKKTPNLDIVSEELQKYIKNNSKKYTIEFIKNHHYIKKMENLVLK